MNLPAEFVLLLVPLLEFGLLVLPVRQKKGLVLKAALMDVWDSVMGNGGVKDSMWGKILVLSFNILPFSFSLITGASKTPAGSILLPRMEGEQYHIQGGRFGNAHSTE